MMILMNRDWIDAVPSPLYTIPVPLSSQRPLAPMVHGEVSHLVYMHIAAPIRYVETASTSVLGANGAESAIEFELYLQLSSRLS